MKIPSLNEVLSWDTPTFVAWAARSAMLILSPKKAAWAAGHALSAADAALQTNHQIREVCDFIRAQFAKEADDA